MMYSNTEFNRCLRDIRAHCLQCVQRCTTANCRLRPWRLKFAEQMDAFSVSKKRWMVSALAYADLFFSGDPVRWDDFSNLLVIQVGKPVHPNWIGQLAATMRRNGFTRLPAEYHSTGAKSKGSINFMWRKNALQ